jgi:hypothetical protein
MAKKTKKQTRKVSRSDRSTSATSVGYTGGADQTGASTVRTPATVGLSSRMSSADFNPDYSQTIKDLKRIGALASTFFVLLVIISFFLR